MLFSIFFGNINCVISLCLRSATAILFITLATVPAGAAVGDWLGEGNARVRFVATGVDLEGRLAAGIEILLKPGWKTYWRSPGDAGIAPLIDFSASTNVGGPIEI